MGDFVPIAAANQGYHARVMSNFSLIFPSLFCLLLLFDPLFLPKLQVYNTNKEVPFTKGMQWQSIPKPHRRLDRDVHSSLCQAKLVKASSPFDVDRSLISLISFLL